MPWLAPGTFLARRASHAAQCAGAGRATGTERRGDAMEVRRRARDQLRVQRALRRRVVLKALAEATADRDRWRARGNARLVARYEGSIRRAEQALAALDGADAADPAE